MMNAFKRQTHYQRLRQHNSGVFKCEFKMN